LKLRDFSLLTDENLDPDVVAPEHLPAVRLKKVLSEHLWGFREVFGEGAAQ
jgi:hypothetical protein